MSEIRVRFAPSPTGFLHIGGARTAIFNWLYARHHHGKFFLRIEDTDQSRSTDEAVEAILDGMRWLGLDWDNWEGGVQNPSRQTDRFEIYKSKIALLLDQGKAYRCYCTAEELASRRKEAMKERRIPRYDGRCRERASASENPSYAIRFKASSEGTILVDDLVKGPIRFDCATVDDLIIARSDGTPTYNFCVVVDDADMGISHVIRGDDHLNNTPRQIQLYEALGYPLPEFAHVPMILGADKARLSKRHGATSVQQYREEGYLPEAMVNYLVRLGWSHKDQEIFTLEELLEKFSIENVGRAAAIFNPEKLRWLNAHYIKTGDVAKTATRLHSYLETFGIAANQVEPAHLEQVVKSLCERSRTMTEMAESAAIFFTEEISYDDKTRKFLTSETLPILIRVREKLEDTPFEEASLKEIFKAVCEEMNLKLAKIAQPVRAAVTGKTVSPGIFDVLKILGREKTFARLDNQIWKLSGKDA